MKKLLFTLTVLFLAFTAFSKSNSAVQSNESTTIKEAVVVESSKDGQLKALLPMLPPKFQSRIANGAPVSYVVVRILESGEEISGIAFGDYVSGEVVKIVDQQKLDTILNLIR